MDGFPKGFDSSMMGGITSETDIGRLAEMNRELIALYANLEKLNSEFTSSFLRNPNSLKGSSDALKAYSKDIALVEAKITELKSVVSQLHNAFNSASSKGEKDAIEAKLREYSKLIANLNHIKSLYSSLESLGRISAGGTNTESKKAEEETKAVNDEKKAYDELAESKKKASDASTNGSKSQKDEDIEAKRAEARQKVGKFMGEADVSWVTDTVTSVEELKATLASLLEDKKALEQKPIHLMDDNELKEYATILAGIQRAQNVLFGGKHRLPLKNDNEEKLTDIDAKAQKNALSSLSDQAKKTGETIKEANEKTFKVWNPKTKKYEERALKEEEKGATNPLNSAKKSNKRTTKEEGKPSVAHTPDGKVLTPVSIDSYKKVVTVLESAKIQAENLREALRNGLVPPDSFASAVKQLQELETEIKRLTKEKELLEGKGSSGTKTKSVKPTVGGGTPPTPPPTDETKYRNILDILRETVRTKAELAKEKTGMLFTSDIDGAEKRVVALKGTLKGLSVILKDVGGGFVASAFSAIGHAALTVSKSIAKLTFKGVVDGMRMVISGSRALVSALKNLVSTGFNLLKNAVSTTLGNMQKLVSSGFNAVKTGVGAAKSAFTKLKSVMHSLVKKSTPNLMKSFGSIKSMLMRRLKRTFISSIFNQAKEGIQELAKHSNEFNKTMSNIKNSAKQSAGNLAVTLGNLITTLEPVITTLLGWFNSLLTAINSVFALLSGKGTVTVAKQNTDDYAKSLKNASGSAKDLNNQLYGFDEITRQESNNSNSSSKISYEEKAVEDMYSDIMNMFTGGKFREIGQKIGNALDNIVLKIDEWIVSIRSKAKEWARNIADILNGIVDTNLIADIGKTIGDAIITASDTIGAFLERFDFDALGKKLGEGFNNLFSKETFDSVGTTIGLYFSSIWETINGLFSNIEWGALGTNLASGFRMMFANLDWDAWKNLWINGINGVLNTLYNFITGIDWHDVTSKLVENVKGIIKGIKWTDKDGEPNLAGTVSEGIKAVLNIFETLVDSKFFTTLAANLGLAVGQILNRVDFHLLAEIVVTGLGHIREAFWNLINRLNITSLAGKLAESINGLLTNEKVQQAWNDADAATIKGLGQIVDAFATLTGPVSEGGIDFDGISSEIGRRINGILDSVDWTKLTQSVLNGITNIVGAFGTFISRLNLSSKAKRIATGVNNFFTQKGDDGEPILVSAANKAGAGISEIIKAFSSFLGELDLTSIAGSISKSIKTFFSNMDFKTILGRISDFVLDATKEFNNLITELTKVDNNGKNLGDRLSDAFNGMFVDEKGNAKEDRFSGLGTSISNAIKSVFESGTSLLDGIKTDKIADDIAAFLKGINWVDLLSTVIKFALTFLKKALLAVGDILGALIDWLASIDWLQVALTIVNGIMGVLGAALEGVVGALGNILMKIFEAIFGKDSREVSALDQFLSDYERDAVTAVMHAQESVAQAYSDSFEGILQGVDKTKLADDAKEQAEFIASSWVDAYAVIATKGENEFKKIMSSYGIDDDVTNELLNRYYALVDSSKDEFGSVLAGFGVTVTEEFASALYDATTTSSENLAHALTLMGLGVNENTLAALDLSNLDENLATFMAKSGKDINDVAKILMSDNKDELAKIAKELGIEVGDDLGNVTPEALKKALLEGKKSVQDAADELAKIADQTENKANMKTNATQTGKDTAESVGKGQKEAVTEVENSAKKVTSAVEEEYEKLPKEVKPYAEQLMKYICTALADGDGTVKSAIESVAQAAVDRAKEILAGSVGIDIAETFIDGIRSGFESSDLTTSIQMYANTVVHTADGILAYGNGYAIGANLIVGMINGVYGRSQWLIDAVADLCNAVVLQTKTIFKWGSPSKVFEDIGGYVMEGFQIGLEDTGKDAIDTVGDIAQAIVNEAENGDTVSMKISAMTDGLDTVTDKMTRLAQVFSDIADTIADMGGLDIPTIASGKVIPYKTQIAENAVTSTMSEGNLEDALYSAFTRAMGNENNQQPIEVKLVVDGRTLADIVTKKQREQSRAWGV